MSIMNAMLAGAIGGMAGSMAMKAMMMLGQQAGIVGEPMPLKIERALEKRLGVDDMTSAGQEQALAMAEHLMIGAAYGAAYGALKASQNFSALPAGPLYGVGVYALNLGALGPGLALTSGPWNEEPMTVGRRLMMHALYGTVTALVTEKALERLDGDGHERWTAPLPPYAYPAL